MRVQQAEAFKQTNSFDSRLAELLFPVGHSTRADPAVLVICQQAVQADIDPCFRMFLAAGAKKMPGCATREPVIRLKRASAFRVSNDLREFIREFLHSFFVDGQGRTVERSELRKAEIQAVRTLEELINRRPIRRMIGRL